MSATPSALPVIRLPGPGGAPVAFAVLFEGAVGGAAVRVLAPEGGMRVFLEVRPGDGPPPSPTDLALRLREAGLRSGISAAALRYLAERAAAGEATGPLQVARGTPPEPGQDGRLDFTDPSGDTQRPEMDEDGNVDFHRTRRIRNALREQTIALLRPAGRGRPGRSVFGRELPAENGRPLAVSAGANVRFLEAERRFVAEEDGQVLFEDGVLRIDPVLEIAGNVDFRIGNIDFVGHVVVRGSVPGGFEVAGRKSVTIHGEVGRCRLRSGGDILLACGIDGRGAGRIEAGGRLTARYLHEVEVEAKGDVEIDREILNSRVRCGGALRIPRGSILGGSVEALRGIEVGSAGSDLGVETGLAAGIDWTAETRLRELQAEIRMLDERLRRVTADAGPTLRDRELFPKLSPADRLAFRTLLERLRLLREAHDLAKKERQALSADTPLGQTSQINAGGTLHAGVTLRFHRLQTALREPLRGPLTAFEDLRVGAVRVVERFPLRPDTERTDRADLKEYTRF